jgi:hypothetical protein
LYWHENQLKRVPVALGVSFSLFILVCMQIDYLNTSFLMKLDLSPNFRPIFQVILQWIKMLRTNSLLF